MEHILGPFFQTLERGEQKRTFMSKHLYSELRAAWSAGSASRFNDIVADHIDALDPRYQIEVGRTAFWFAAAVGAVDAMRLLCGART